MKKQLGFTALAALALSLSACESEEIGGETFEAAKDLFTEGTLVEFSTKSTTTTNYYMQFDTEVKNIEGYGDLQTDTVNGINSCGEIGRVTQISESDGVGTYHIVGKQTAYITPGANNAEIATDYNNGPDSDDILTYREGWLDIVNPTINPQYYQNLECDCFGDPLKNAEIELYYAEYNSMVSSTYNLLEKVTVQPNPNPDNLEVIIDNRSYTNGSAPEITNDLHLYGWYGLEGYLWELELLSDNALTPTSSGGFPMSLDGNVSQMLPEDAQVGDSWFSTQTNPFFTQGYLFSIVAEEDMVVKDAEGEDRTITTLHVVRRGTDQEPLVDGKIMGTTCWTEEKVQEGDGEVWTRFFDYDKCRETSWVNEGHYWFYNNVMVKRIEDTTTITVDTLRSGYREAPDARFDSLAQTCDDDVDAGDGYMDIVSEIDANDSFYAPYKPYAEFTVTQTQSTWVATAVRDDATLVQLHEEEHAAE